MPILLPANQPDQFYKGGPQVAQFRGGQSPAKTEHTDDYHPEDWIGSTTACFGKTPLGLTVLPDGRYLNAAVAEDPQYWLGSRHVERFGADTKLLVKLIDAGQRLPVHAHPHGDWAKAHIKDAKHGKAEAWYILQPGEVYVSLSEDVDGGKLKELVEKQDIDGILGKMHKFEVQPGDTVYVAPGTLHALGHGLLVIEIQEPSDLSIQLEWGGFKQAPETFAEKGHLGVGWDVALTGVDRQGRQRDEVEGALVVRGSARGNLHPNTSAATRTSSGVTVQETVFARASEEYFRTDLVTLTAGAGEKHSLEAGFALAIVLDGEVELTTAQAGAAAGSSSNHPQQLSLKKGSTALVAHGEGDFTMQGQGQVLVARPPKAN